MRVQGALRSKGRRGVVRQAIALLLLASLAASAPGGATAGWVDDWVAQKTETSPGYFEGQKRGYYTGGGFSARWNLQNDYLWSVTAPKLKTGCGGIDAFMGGFSFLNADYLVQKLQRIMSAAPAAAFDIALKTLAPQVSETIGKLENLSNKLNNIQLDECKSARAMVATIASPFTNNAQQGEMAAIQADWWSSTGAGDLWTEFQKQRKADGDKPDPAASAGSMSGCSADFKAVFASGSLITNAAGRMGLSDADYMRLIRGYVGDIFIQAPDPANNINAYKVIFDEPCEKQDLQALLDGNAQGKDVNGACTQIPDANRNLRQYVHNRMLAVANKYRNRQALSAEEEAFVNTSPLAVGLVLKTAVGEKQEGQIIAQLSEVTAKAYAFALLSDLYAKARSIFDTSKALMSAQGDPVGNNPAHTCKIENVQTALGSIESMEGRLFHLMGAAQGEYATMTAELNTLYEFVRKQKTFSDEVYKTLSSKFGEGVANRALGG